MLSIRAVIIGNGVAGIMTAVKLRELEPDKAKLDIAIYTREPYEYYSRIRLPEVFSSALSAGDLAIHKPGWYEGKDIAVYKNQEVVGIDREARRIRLKKGGAVPYDGLVLCMGADSFKPPIGNSELEGIFTIREYGDAEAIRSSMTAGTRHAVVLGGGLLGLEAARHMDSPGILGITIVEVMPRLLPRQLDEEGSELLRSLVEGKRCSVILGVKAESFVGEKRVEGLRLADGREIQAETAVISAGILPRVGLAQEAGLAVDRGVIVDDHMRTSDPHIWAAGDLAEFEGIVWGIIPAALDHAPVAAADILGRETAGYRQTVPQNTLKVAGIDLTSMGKVTLSPEDAASYRVIAKLDAGKKRYEKYVLLNGELAGCILLGSRDNYGFASQRIGKPVTPEEIEARLW
jgi:nitrite reductase (NADH) large subunit